MPDRFRPKGVLVIEDNDDDFEAIERAMLRNAGFDNPILRCRDGAQAWRCLTENQQVSAMEATFVTGLILLDLNMPGLDGRKLLSRIKTDDNLRQIPVIVMTTSTANEDVRTCYRMGANSYVRKPVSWRDFAAAVASLQTYWFRTAVLPDRGA